MVGFLPVEFTEVADLYHGQTDGRGKVTRDAGRHLVWAVSWEGGGLEVER